MNDLPSGGLYVFIDPRTAMDVAGQLIQRGIGSFNSQEEAAAILRSTSGMATVTPSYSSPPDFYVFYGWRFDPAQLPSPSLSKTTVAGRDGWESGGDVVVPFGDRTYVGTRSGVERAIEAASGGGTSFARAHPELAELVLRLPQGNFVMAEAAPASSASLSEAPTGFAASAAIPPGGGDWRLTYILRFRDSPSAAAFKAQTPWSSSAFFTLDSISLSGSDITLHAHVPSSFLEQAMALAAGGFPGASQNPASGSNSCSDAYTCDSCISLGSCGWSSSRGACLPGSSSGSDDGLSAGSDWAWTSCAVGPSASSPTSSPLPSLGPARGASPASASIQIDADASTSKVTVAHQGGDAFDLRDTKVKFQTLNGTVDWSPVSGSSLTFVPGSQLVFKLDAPGGFANPTFNGQPLAVPGRKNGSATFPQGSRITATLSGIASGATIAEAATGTAYYVSLSPLSTVLKGGSIQVEGTTNLPDSTPLLVSATGPKDLETKIATVRGGAFSATFSASEIGDDVGTYTVTAKSQYGDTDTGTVSVVAGSPCTLSVAVTASKAWVEKDETSVLTAAVSNSGDVACTGVALASSVDPPAGATLTWEETSVDVPAKDSVSVAGNFWATADGSYTVSMTATGGAATDNGSVTIQVGAPSTPAPTPRPAPAAYINYRSGVCYYSGEGPGTLIVSSTPAATDVYVDDVLVGTTTLTVPGTLQTPVDPGEHTLRVSKADYSDYYVMVCMRPTENTFVEAQLRYAGQ